MLDASQVVSSTVIKSAPRTTPQQQQAPSNSLLSNSTSWENEDQFPDSASKFSPIKIEETSSTGSAASTNSTSESTTPTPSSDFAELKPALPYGFASLSGLDPVLTTTEDDLEKKPPATMTATTATGARTAATSSSNSAASTNDVSSSGASTPPNGITKLETLDFTASQDAFDDLASIVGISMGADSTVPNMDGDLDLDAWIENTAQNIRPLVVGGDVVDSLLASNQHHASGNSASSTTANTLAAAAAAAACLRNQQTSGPYIQLQTTTSVASSTLQSLLQGNLTPGPPPLQHTIGKVTQLQQRDASGTTSAPPPPYSILQNRLQHGSVGPPHDSRWP